MLLLKAIAILCLAAFVSASRPPDYSGHEHQSYDYGEWSYPYDCKPGYCYYKANWKYLPKTDSVWFKVHAKVPRGYWAGIGFSNDRMMPASDCVTGWVPSYGKGFHLFDRYLIQRNKFFVGPDKQQDAHRESYSYHDGWLTYTFTRKRDTWDNHDITLTQCRYFLFAWEGKASVQYGIEQHRNAHVSNEKICIGPLIQTFPRVPSAYGGGKYDNYYGYYNIPEYCEGDKCAYKAEWKYDRKSDSVEFTIDGNVGKGQWLGIGFSENPVMPSSDAVIGYIPRHGHDIRLVDRYLVLREEDRVPVDTSQDAKLTSFAYKNGRLRYSFVRKRYTKDPYDVPLTVCRYLLFAWGGKAYSDKSIKRHAQAIPSKKKICIGPVDYERHTDGDYVYKGPADYSDEYFEPYGYGDEDGYGPDPCYTVDCGNHASCKGHQGKPRCYCSSGYKNQGGSCY